MSLMVSLCAVLFPRRCLECQFLRVFLQTYALGTVITLLHLSHAMTKYGSRTKIWISMQSESEFLLLTS